VGATHDLFASPRRRSPAGNVTGYYAIFKVLEECLHSIRTIQTHNFSHFLHKNLKKPLAEKSDNGFCGEVPLKRNKVPESKAL
jgi:hypothetical protein